MAKETAMGAIITVNELLSSDQYARQRQTLQKINSLPSGNELHVSGVDNEKLPELWGNQKTKNRPLTPQEQAVWDYSNGFDGVQISCQDILIHPKETVIVAGEYLVDCFAAMPIIPNQKCVLAFTPEEAAFFTPYSNLDKINESFEFSIVNSDGSLEELRLGWNNVTGKPGKDLGLTQYLKREDYLEVNERRLSGIHFRDNLGRKIFYNGTVTEPTQQVYGIRFFPASSEYDELFYHTTLSALSCGSIVAKVAELLGAQLCNPDLTFSRLVDEKPQLESARFLAFTSGNEQLHQVFRKWTFHRMLETFRQTLPSQIAS